LKPGIRKAFKIAGLGLGGLIVLVVAAALLLVFDKPLTRGLIRRQLGRSPGMAVRFAGLDYSLFPFRLTVEGLEASSEDRYQKLSARVARLEAKGDFWKLIRGVKPALETVEAKGVLFRYEEKAPSETPVDIEKLLLSVSDTLAWSRRIAVSEARLSLVLLSGPTEIRDLDLTLTAGPVPDVFDYSIGRAGVALSDAKGGLVLATSLTSSGRLGFVSPYTVDVSFALGATRFNLAGVEGGRDGLTLSLAGRLDRAVQELVVSRLTVDAPGLFNIDGRMTGKQGYGTFIEAEARGRIEDLAAAAALLGPLLPPDIRAASPRGRAGLAGTYVLQSSGQGSKDSLTASLTLDDLALEPRLEGRPVRLRASGRIDLAGPTSDPRVTAEIRAATGPFAAGGLAAKSSALRVAATGTRAGAEISRLETLFTGLAYDAGLDRRVAFDRASLSATGTVDLARKEAVLTALDARLPGLPPVRIGGRYGLGPASPVELRLDTRGLDIPALRALAAPFLPPGLAGWDLGGAMDLALSVSRARGARDDWRVAAKAALAGIKFNDPSFTVAGEGLDPVLSLEASGSPAKGLDFKAGLDIGKGESLWKAVYVAWEKHPLKVEASGRYLPASGALEGLSAHFLMPGVGTIDVTGGAALGPAPAFDLAVESRFSLGPLYSLYTQAGVAEAARTKLEGTLGATVNARKSASGLSVGGRIRLSETNVESPTSKTLLIGVSADLPFAYGSASAAASDAPLPEAGFLRIGEFQSPFLTLKPVEVPLRAGPNALAIEPFGLALFGGRLELGRTVFRLDPSTGALAGVGSLALRDIDIARFPIQSPQFRLTGKIQAEFPRLDISSDRIAVSGRGAASVFGGQVVLRDLGVTAPFSAQRTISLNVDLVDLDMKKLTDEVPFGEVTGIVRGEIRDLVISYGQPDRFTFRIESVPRKGVPQTFSLKAVDNLTVLSSGQKASTGGGAFWMSFVRGFRYSKLGIASTLRNDTFTLSGTIHEGGTEYLVKKPSLFGISVVNREPGKKISFREMTSRLKRVGQSDK